MLAMAMVPPVVLASFELHDHDLAPPGLPHHLRADPRSRQARSPHEHLAVPVHQEDVGEFDGRALVAWHLLHGDDLTRADPVLLAAGGDDRIHVLNTILNRK